MKTLFASVPADGHFNPLTATDMNGVLGEPRFLENVAKLRAQLAEHGPFALIESVIVGAPGGAPGGVPNARAKAT